MADSREILLEVKGLEKSFGDRKVLNNIELQVAKGKLQLFWVRRAAGRVPSCDV